MTQCSVYDMHKVWFKYPLCWWSVQQVVEHQGLNQTSAQAFVLQLSGALMDASGLVLQLQVVPTIWCKTYVLFSCLETLSTKFNM